MRMTHGGCYRTYLMLATSAVTLMVAGGAQAQVRKFDVPAQPAVTGVPQFGKQAETQILAPQGALQGKRVNAVQGDYSVGDGLELLLRGTNLSVISNNGRTIVLDQAAPAAIPIATNPAPGGEPAQPAATTVEEVVVTGLRGSLNSARARKRDAEAISDSIVAQDIGKLPDQNIAEAAQRIPGVQLQRYKEEGASIQIRGLPQTKVVLNGLEVFGSSAHNGEYNGRSFDLEDLPAEVLAGVDIYKSSTADQTEGGLGGYVNVRTRRPFDFPGAKAAVAVKATRYDMAPGFGGKWKGQASALLSGRWQTKYGEMGLLVNAAHAESVFGTAEDEVQRTQQIANYAGSGKTVTLPIGMFTGNGHHGDRERTSYIGAFQWRPSDALEFHLDVIDLDYLVRDNFQTARFNLGTPTSQFTLWDASASPANLKTGTFTGNSMTDTSVFGDEGRKSRIYDAGLAWDNGGPLRVRAGISRNETEVVNTLFEWGLNANIPTIALTMNAGSPSHVSVSGVDLTNKAVYAPLYLLAINLNGEQTSTAGVIDAHYAFGDTGLIRSVDFGARANDYTRHSFGFVDFYCIDGCASAKTLASVDPSLLRQVPASESRDVGAYWTFSTDAVRQQLTLRGLYGLPLVDENQKAQDQLNNEKSLAGYAKVNYGLDLLSRPVTGNLGVRVIRTKLHGESYGADAAGTLALQKTDTTRTDVLPSANAKIELGDKFFLRLAASKTLGQVNFAYLSSAVNISNPVQHDAQAGNPDLKPYTSRNLDASLERYFGSTGLLYMGLFDKKVDGFIQTVAQQRVIDGQTYNVSTYASAGRSTVRGVEIGYQQFFDFLPAPFDGLGAQANYTYVDSSAPSSVAGRRVSLQGLSKNSYNLVGMYEKGRVKARLAYNYRDDFVVSTSSSGAQGVPIYAAPVGTLDFSLGFDVNEQLSIVLDGVNVNGAHTEQYYGSRQNQMNYLPINKRYGVQLRYTF
jgi:TonB-dependent receptor